MIMIPKYSINIHYRVVEGSDRERVVLECAREYGCSADTHLFDRLLEDRLVLFLKRKEELVRLDVEQKALDERRRKLGGG